MSFFCFTTFKVVKVELFPINPLVEETVPITVNESIRT
jgi:hypothetical protein